MEIQVERKSHRKIHDIFEFGDSEISQDVFLKTGYNEYDIEVVQSQTPNYSAKRKGTEGKLKTHIFIKQLQCIRNKGRL